MEALEAIIEQLAVKIHEAWMEYRRAEGWTYGERQDDLLKRHPSMVVFEHLSDGEKEVDRRSARTTIQGLVELGYDIIHTAQSTLANTQPSDLDEVRQQLLLKTQLPLGSLGTMWKHCRDLPNCPAEVCLMLGMRILKLGEAVLAYDPLLRARTILKAKLYRSGPEEKIFLQVRQQLALSLVQCGAAERARRQLIQLCQEGHETPETLGLLGRAYKDLAKRESNEKRRKERLEESLRHYLHGFKKADSTGKDGGAALDADDAFYCGINAAALLVLCGDLNQARGISDRVKQICEMELKKSGPNYWLLATLGETELIGNRYESAKTWYKRAVESFEVAGNWRELMATRGQARLLATALGSVVADWDDLFPKASILVFASPPFDGQAVPTGDWEERLSKTFDQRLNAAGIIAGYLGGLSPADVLLCESLLRKGAEAHIILPYGRDLCRQAFEGIPNWKARFDQVLSTAATVIEDTQKSSLNDSVNMEFAALRAYGSGRLRAAHLDSKLYLWGLDQAPWQKDPNQTGFLTQHWHKPDCLWEDIMPSQSAPAQFNPVKALDKSDSQSTATASYQIRAMLFADVKGYSKLDDAALFCFNSVFLPRVAVLLDEFGAHVLSKSTAGDGLFLVFSEIETAAQAAFALLNMMMQTPWESLGLPRQLEIRISLDAGPVYTFPNVVMRTVAVCGAYVNRAARIEPITPPNEVYASEAFSALYVATGEKRFRFDYVGQTELPKGMGLTPLYCLAENS